MATLGLIHMFVVKVLGKKTVWFTQIKISYVKGVEARKEKL